MSDELLDYIVAGVLWTAVVIYATFAGADFGGGVWDLFARGPRAQQQRRSVSRAMGPVWEANHVWLIFMITGLFTAFPTAFSALALGLYLPFSIALLGIVLRGAAFAFRAHGASQVSASAWGLAFGIASTVTPFVLGAAAGAVASGGVHPGAAADPGTLLASWTTPFALACGGLALAICAGLAAVYLCVEEDALGHRELADDFRRRAIAAGLASLLLALVALPLLLAAAPRLWSGLVGPALPLFAASFGFAAVAGWAITVRRYRIARGAAISQVGAILFAWAVAQYPLLVPPDISVTSSASPPETMALLLAVLAAGGALLGPSLLILFRVFKGQNPVAV